METTFIYSLNCPISKITRYIGKSNTPKGRYDRHLKSCIKKTSSHNAAWLKSLLLKELKPELEIIDEVLCSEWQFWEKHYISLYKSWGFNLTNQTPGGESGVGVKKGYKYSEEVNARRKPCKWKGCKLPQEWKDNISKGTSGRIKSYEECKKLSNAHKGKKKSKQHIEKRRQTILSRNYRGENSWKSKIVLNIETGIYYSSMTEVCKLFNISGAHLSVNLRSKNNKTKFIYA